MKGKGEDMETYREFEGIEVEQPIGHVGVKLSTPKITLDKIYKQGWWITEIFGSYANIVCKSVHFSKTRPDFCCRSVHINVTQLTPQAIRKINKISREQWKKYKHIILRRVQRNYSNYL